jgi:hypothetical protein
MTRPVALALACGFAVTGGPSLGQTLTCETSGTYWHCFDHHGYLSTEERGAISSTAGTASTTHGTEWRQGDRTYTWPTR